jgi:hypothetical protein
MLVSEYWTLRELGRGPIPLGNVVSSDTSDLRFLEEAELASQSVDVVSITSLGQRLLSLVPYSCSEAVVSFDVGTPDLAALLKVKACHASGREWRTGS